MNFYTKLWALAVFMCATSCSSDSSDSSDAAIRASVVGNYAENTYQSYLQSLNTAKHLQSAVNAFVASPSEGTLEVAKRRWLEARQVYGQTEAHRFYDGPIDDPEHGPEGKINPWPLDESFIDGIINDSEHYAELTPSILADLNNTSKPGENQPEEALDANVATGYHAIEYLLWGQDRNATSAGTRSFTDYTTASNFSRRKIYLVAVTDLLVSDLQIITNAWISEQNNYRKTFEEGDSNVALRKMIMAMGILSKEELGSERMDVALNSRDQEDEHSCFSDNTHIDLLMNQLGIINVYLGRYGVTDGPGLDELVRAIDPVLDASIQKQLFESYDKLIAIPVPFDQAILSDEGRAAIDAAITSIRSQGNKIAGTTVVLGLEALVINDG